MPCLGVKKAKCGVKINGLPRKRFELCDGTLVIARFAIDFPVGRGNLVTANDQRVRVLLGNGAGLGFCEAE